MNKHHTTVLLLIGVLFILLGCRDRYSLRCVECSTNNQDSEILEYMLPESSIAILSVDQYRLEKQLHATMYQPLREELLLYLATQNADINLYFEDLHSGGWMGIDESALFFPGSLLKVPLMAATLKKIEEGNWSLNTELIIAKEDLDPGYGTLYREGANVSYTVWELLDYVSNTSDNTAYRTLLRNMEYGEMSDALTNLGLPRRIESVKNSIPLSPRHVGRFFSSLFHGDYLHRSSSQLILSLLAESPFTKGIPAGVPPPIKVSHKQGSTVLDHRPNNHDCGIVFAPAKPYVLCIMVGGPLEAQAHAIMQDISAIIYTYVAME